MQLLPPLTADPAAWRREASVGRHLPYLAQIDDCTILTRDDQLVQMIRLDGVQFETLDSEDVNYSKAMRDAAFRAIGVAGLTIHHHVIRRRLEIALPSDYPDDFSGRLDDAWRRRLSRRSLFGNDLYLTLVRRLPARRGGLFRGRFGSAADGARDCVPAAALRDLAYARDALLSALVGYRPALLGLRASPGGDRSEPLEFLHTLLTGATRPVLLPRQALSDHIADRRISFGQNMVDLGATGASPRRFCAMLSIKEYPGQTAPGMFDELLRLPFEMTMAQSFAFVGRRAALSRMNLALRRMRAADDEAVSLRAELALAKDDVASGRADYGEHHMTVAVRGATLSEVDAGVAETQAVLADLGIMAAREEIALEPAFWAQFPGNARYVPRRGLVSTRNLAAFFSCHNFPIGRAAGNHWGDAITVLETSAAGPYFFNFHRHDLGNFTLIGPSGSGKTVVLNFLLAQARKHRPRIAFFDKDRGAELFIRAIGGRYDRLRPGIASGMNPLQLPDTATNRQFLADFLTRLVHAEGPEEAAAVADAIDANYEQPASLRRLRHLRAVFRGGARPRADDLWNRLAPWVEAGEHAWLFDNADDLLDLSADSIGFDMTQVLDDPDARAPTMMYLFHRVEERLDGSPSIIVVDEGWKALDDEVFTQRIRDWEKTIRKRNGIVGFATQSAQDALESRIASAIVEQAATQIFMANPKARAADYVDGFGLTRHEFDLVRTLPPSTHAFLVKHGNDSVVVRLDLSGESDLLTILSGRERTVRILDDLRVRVGDDPAAWMPRLLELA